MGTTLTITAPAKVNLFLAVGALRPDGYHDVTTVLHALALHDTVTIVAETPFAFACSPDPGVAADDNLALMAARSMSSRFGRTLDVAISIEKRIPAGGGLGGASADAAAVLTGLAALWCLPAGEPALGDIARQLGADVAFFLEGGSALFTGRGDVLERPLSTLDAHVVLVKPDSPVPTAAAYGAFDRIAPVAPRSPESLLRALDAGDAAAVGSALYNSMTPASVGLVPAIAEALGFVERGPGVLGAAMAGSGSTVFGICASAADAEGLAASARDAGFWALSTRFAPDGCVITAA